MTLQQVTRTFKGFPCVICNENPRIKKGVSKPFRICRDCFREIKGLPVYRNIKTKDSICVVCGITIHKRHQSIPTCSDACRGKYYRILNAKNEIKTAIETNNFSVIGKYTIKYVQSLEFDVQVTERSPFR